MVNNISKTFSFKTLGCKLNQSESDAIVDQFKRQGFLQKEFGEPADFSVINTCTVTNDADSKSRAAIRMAVRSSPQGRTIVTGCYAQIKPEEIQTIDGVSLILGTDEKYHILDHLKQIENVGRGNHAPTEHHQELHKPLTIVNDKGEFATVSEDGFISATNRTRAFLKVQEGCDYYCSYCIIPFARGKARSRPYENTLEEAKKLADQGYREIVLTGINIGTYQYQNGHMYNIVNLLDGLQRTPGLDRIRLSSIEPNTVSHELLQLIAESKVLCPHLHIPLQGGNDDLLAAMNRKYRTDLYLKLMEDFRKLLPNAALGTDVIVGFPGETEAHFLNTLQFIAAQPFSYMHIFRYSDRSGTVASKLANHVDPELIKTRSKILTELMQKQKIKFAEKFIGQTMPVLFDHQTETGFSGYTPNYLRVSVNTPHDLRNQILPVQLQIAQAGSFTGTLLGHE